MLAMSLIILIIAISLCSATISSLLLTRITAQILFTSAICLVNYTYSFEFVSGLGIFSGLFQVTSLSQYFDKFLFFTASVLLLPWLTPKINIKKVSSYLKSVVTIISEYPLIVIFSLIGASFLISSTDLVAMYICIELQSFAVYLLAAIYKNRESATSAGLKYFLLGALSSALILLGASLIYAYTGLTSLENISMLISVPTDNSNIIQGIILGIIFITVGFLFKIGAAPFHNWAPDVYDAVPTIVTIWLIVMPKISILIFLLELSLGNGANLLIKLGTNISSWNLLFLFSSLISFIIGTVVGYWQIKLKRLLTFSTISNLGFMLLALAINTEDSISAMFFYLIQYSLVTVNTFFIILAFGYMIYGENEYKLAKGLIDIDFISELKGLFSINPLLSLSLAICMFSFVGINWNASYNK